LFFYVYRDICFYDSCSWRDDTVQNPLIKYIVELFDVKQRNQTVPTVEDKKEEPQQQPVENVEAN
jgi:hypothetical protein